MKWLCIKESDSPDGYTGNRFGSTVSIHNNYYSVVGVIYVVHDANGDNQIVKGGAA